MTDTVTLYSKPGCVQCVATARAFKDKEVTHKYIDVSEVPESIALIKELGYLSLPVVVVGENTHWTGYRPDLIKEHILQVA